MNIQGLLSPSVLSNSLLIIYVCLCTELLIADIHDFLTVSLIVIVNNTYHNENNKVTIPYHTIELAKFLQCSEELGTNKGNHFKIMQQTYMETINWVPKTHHVEQDSGKPDCFQSAFFSFLTPSDKWLFWLLLMPTFSNHIICRACVSCTMLLGKLMLANKLMKTNTAPLLTLIN